jgi:hypothetical protein
MLSWKLGGCGWREMKPICNEEKDGSGGNTRWQYSRSGKLLQKDVFQEQIILMVSALRFVVALQ